MESLFDTNQSDDIANQLMDKLLIECPINDPFSIDGVLKEDLKQFDRYTKSDIGDIIRIKLMQNKYAYEQELSGYFKLSPKGQEIKKAGGHIKFTNDQSEKILKRERLELENLQSTNTLNTWLYKTRYLPHILSIIALILSILALIFS